MDGKRIDDTTPRRWHAASGFALVLIACSVSRVTAEPAATTAPAGAAPAFALIRSTIDAGGARSSGGNVVVQGTIGQHDADPDQPSPGGSFAITGGFWTGAVAAGPAGDPIFSNGFEGS
ncbi:MAG TPA: hypothetical protein VND91_02085 [Candidatus Saccharimonadia bacterium]|nr:hypothetical protein [Candidatus Saccharimonadia bacterium]